MVTSQLTKGTNFWLHNLTNDLKKVEEAEILLKEYKNYQDDNLHQSVMNIIVQANKEVFMEARGMCQALFELMEDEIKERENRAKEEELKLIVTKMLKKDMSAIDICDIAGCTPEYLQNLKKDIS